jgi:hypothetical protein
MMGYDIAALKREEAPPVIRLNAIALIRTTLPDSVGVGSIDDPARDRQAYR